MTTFDPDEIYLKSRVVLYAEDDKDVRTQSAQFLRRRVRRLIVAEDGKQALEAFTAETPDIIVTDIRMPVLDGLELIDKVRQVAPRIPVVVTTAFDDANYLMKSIRLGISRYLLKPVNADSFDAALRHCARLLRADEETALRQVRERELDLARRDEAMGSLLASIAYEYGELMQVMAGAFSMFERETHEGSRSPHMTDALAALAKSRDLTARLALAYEQGRMHFELQPLEPVVQAARARLEPGSDRRVTIHIPGGLPALSLQRERATRMLQLLFYVGLAAVPDSAPLVVKASSVTLAPSEVPSLPSGRYVRVDVTAAGWALEEPQGGPQESASRWSESAADASLGLNIAQSIIRMHRGALLPAPKDAGGVRLYFPVEPGALMKQP